MGVFIDIVCRYLFRGFVRFCGSSGLGVWWLEYFCLVIYIRFCNF